MDFKKFLLIKVIINNEEHCGKPPGDGVAHQDSPYSRPVRHCQENPEDTEDTHTGTGHDHGDQYIAHASQGTGQDFYKDKENIGRSDNLYDLHADFNDFRVSGKELEQIPSQKQQQSTYQERSDKVQEQADFNTF